MNTKVLDEIFDSLGSCLTTEVAENLQRLRLSDELQTQLDGWADLNSTGKLGLAEREQYESILRALNFVAVLQAKAKKIAAAKHL